MDHNEIGGEGVTALALGLSINKSLLSLSLTYCNIDVTGARALFEILIYTQSNYSIPLILENYRFSRRAQS